METNAARAKIFARIRAAQGRAPELFAQERESALGEITRGTQGPRPRPSEDLLAAFLAQACKMASTVETIARAEEIPAAASRYLDSQDLTAAQVTAWPEFAAMEWGDRNIVFGAPQRNAKLDSVPSVGLTGSFCGIAETGSVVLLSDTKSLPSAALLPETHIAVVYADQIVDGMEDMFAMVRRASGAVPRSINIISGPSRTADIEQTVVMGAHGPYRMRILVVENRP